LEKEQVVKKKKKRRTRKKKKYACPITKSTMTELFLQYQSYCIFFIAHAWSGHISSSGVKSDVTTLFLDPNFCKDAKISAIRVRLRQI